MKKTLHLYGYASGIAAQNWGCGEGPTALQQRNALDDIKAMGIETRWELMLTPPNVEPKQPMLAHVVDLCQQLAAPIKETVRHQHPFVTIGGDHSCAIGTWGGAKAALAPEDRLGLLWIDAHMDSHTFETTHSQAIHGMPLSALLGHGDPALTSLAGPPPTLLPEHVALVGIRSFEPEEQQLLDSMNVRVYTMDDVKQHGIDTIIHEAYLFITQHTTHFGISIDLDALDPSDAPGVGSLEPDGLALDPLCDALRPICRDPRLIGLEIAEYNPLLDPDYKTEHALIELIKTYGSQLAEATQ